MASRQFGGIFGVIRWRTCGNAEKIFMLLHYGVVARLDKITLGSTTGR